MMQNRVAALVQHRTNAQNYRDALQANWDNEWADLCATNGRRETLGRLAKRLTACRPSYPGRGSAQLSSSLSQYR